jgi:nickel/cobalt transporter (NicO) family protein
MGDGFMPRRALSLTAFAGAVVLLTATAAWAGDSATAGPGLWTRVASYVMEQQGLFHQQLRDELTALGRQGSFATAWALIASSFAYGVFHAAGPGHGKVVLTTYLVSHERRIGRAMVLSAAAALCQGVVAIVLVFGLIWLAGFAGRETQGAALWAERASFAMIAVLGLYLVVRSLRGLLRRHGHDPHHHHDHGPDGDCGHVHVVSPEAARSVHDLRTAIAVVVSVGLRPCSGAVLVLAVASILHLAWAGALAVLAMSAGTAITVCAIALFAVFASDRASRLAGMRGRALAVSARLVSLAGGAIILAAGVMLFIASFGAAHPLGMGAAY